MQVLERLFAAGLRPIAIPPYESALCMHRGECAVVLAPVENGGLKVIAPPSLLIDGHFSVRLKRPGGEVFVWKQREVAATANLLEELSNFRKTLNDVLELPAVV
jgi:hypothetical protein